MTAVSISDIKRREDKENPEMTDEQLDAIIGALRESPLCSRCGSGIRGAPHLETFQCPRCNSHMRHNGGIWLERVSPLDLSAAMPPAGKPVRKFKFTK